MKSIRAIKLAQDQRGIASILVAGIFIVIISLIATSFAVLMRREQRQALDRQLSSQAYYAAESGVNDAIKYLQNYPGATSSDCSQTQQVTGRSPAVNSDAGVAYTCVLVDNTPETLEYSPVDTNRSTILKLVAPGVQSIKISWQPEDGATNYVANPIAHPLPQAESDSTNSTQVRESGILRVSLMPVRSPLNRDELIRQTQTLFLYSNKNNNPGQNGTHAYAEGKDGQGVFVDGECNVANTNDCNVVINNLPAGVDTYYVRLKSIYTQESVTISASTAEDANGGRIEFAGSQAVIDATGKANDVLRRIQVRVPLNANYNYPEFALETTDTICKNIQWFLPSYNYPNGLPTTNTCPDDSGDPTRGGNTPGGPGGGR